MALRATAGPTDTCSAVTVMDKLAASILRIQAKNAMGLPQANHVTKGRGVALT